MRSRRACGATWLISSAAGASTPACRCRAAARSPSRRRSVRSCPRDGKVLVPNNGAYCARIVRICGYLGRGGRRSAGARGPAGDGRDRRGRVGRRSVDHACGAGSLRDRCRDAQRSRRHRAGLCAAWQGAHRRCDELVRRVADRCRAPFRSTPWWPPAASASKAFPAWASSSSGRRCSKPAPATPIRWRWTCTISTSTWRRRRSGATRRRHTSWPRCALR